MRAYNFLKGGEDLIWNAIYNIFLDRDKTPPPAGQVDQIIDRLPFAIVSRDLPKKLPTNPVYRFLGGMIGKRTVAPGLFSHAYVEFEPDSEGGFQGTSHTHNDMNIGITLDEITAQIERMTMGVQASTRFYVKNYGLNPK